MLLDTLETQLPPPLEEYVLCEGVDMQLDTLSHAFSRVSKIAAQFGFEHFIIAYLPVSDQVFSIDDFVLQNLSFHELEDLVSMNFMVNWSVGEKVQRTTSPFTQDGCLARKSSVDNYIVTNMKITDAHCIPLVTIGYRRAFAVFLSKDEVRHEVDPYLQLSTQTEFEKIEILKTARTRITANSLNARELECLEWAAAGKTSSEIAVIVSLSEHTVNHYLISCCRKLDCTNRIQAVAKAIRSRLIA